MNRLSIVIGTFIVMMMGHQASALTLLGHWNLNEAGGTTAFDASGNANTATFNAGTPTRVAGFIGNAVDFPAGSSNYFNTATLDELAGATGLTVSGWINPDTNGGFRGILVARQAQTSIGGSTGNWGINHEGTSIDARVQTTPTGSNGLNTANNSIATNAWTHVSMTWDRATGNRNVYLNGTSVASDSLSAGTNWIDGGPWQIGNDTCCGGRVFDGRLDDLAIHDSALSAAQVQQIYNAGLNNVDIASASAAAAPLAGVQAGLVGSWHMDQADGTTAAGDSINGNNAVLSGATPSTAWVPGQIGRALELDGSNDEAIVAGISQINGSTAMTLSMWVRNDGGNEGYEGLFQHRSAGNANQQGLMTPSNQINPNGPNQPNDIMGRLVNNGTIITTPGNAIPTGGAWTHVVQRYEAGVLHEIYINGQLVAQDAAPPNLPIISDGAWRFGNDQCCGNRFFDGAIDDTALYNRSISTQEIEAIRQAGLHSISHTRAFVPVDGVIQKDLVGHWTFDQARFSPQANDSFNNADATLTSMDSNSAWVVGKIGGALQFDGSNDQAIISGAASAELNGTLNGATALTMSMWVRSDGNNNNNEGLFEHRSPNNANLTGFNTPGAGTDNFDFRINSSSIKSADGTLVDGEWMFLTGVWTMGDRFELWINGEMSTSGTGSASPLVADGDWRFGNDLCCGSGRAFNGALDDVGLWLRALNQSDIQALYVAGLNNFNLQQTHIPEPAISAMLLLGVAPLLRRRRQRAAC